jgi:uncharacterized Zn finger protein
MFIRLYEEQRLVSAEFAEKSISRENRRTYSAAILSLKPVSAPTPSFGNETLTYASENQ